METAFIDIPPLELRREGEQRILRVRCVPYGEVSHKAGGRPERFRAGAFATAAAHAGKIRLRDANHSKDRLPVGVGQSFEDLPDGLYGEYRVYNTPEGRAAIENVEEGVYAGVSVGFYAEDEDSRRRCPRDPPRDPASRLARRGARLRRGPRSSRCAARTGTRPRCANRTCRSSTCPTTTRR